MTNHELLAFIYNNGPCTHAEIDFEFGCGLCSVTFRTMDLVFAGLINYDVEAALFSYVEDSWLQ